MTSRIRTVATHAFQIWLRPDEPSLGWNEPAVTISAYLRPFETWASMPQTLWSEDWPEHDRPGTVAYFCGTLNATWPTTEVGAGYLRRYQRQVQEQATTYIDRNLRPFFPHAVTDQGFSWQLLSGVNGERGSAALGTQHVSVNVDPSDRYVQSVPGTERYRLRPDESGYDNLVFGRRLDRLGHERGLHRGRGDVGSPGRERPAGPAPLSPHPRALHAVSRLCRLRRVSGSPRRSEPIQPSRRSPRCSSNPGPCLPCGTRTVGDPSRRPVARLAPANTPPRGPVSPKPQRQHQPHRAGHHTFAACPWRQPETHVGAA